MTDAPNAPRDGPDDRAARSMSDSGGPTDGDWNLVSQVHYDAAGPDGLTVAIVEAVAEAEGVPSTAILDPPLYDSVDAVELESTLADAGEDVGPDAGSVEFVYRGYLVAVRGNGWVLVHERD